MKNFCLVKSFRGVCINNFCFCIFFFIIIIVEEAEEVYLNKVLFDKNLFESIVSVLKMKINLYVIKFFLKYFRC